MRPMLGILLGAVIACASALKAEDVTGGLPWAVSATSVLTDAF